jgi:hypothetical protein
MISLQGLPAEETREASEGVFVPVQGPDREQVSASASVVVAYLLIWAIFMLFIFLTWRKLRRLRLLAGRLNESLKAGG